MKSFQYVNIYDVIIAIFLFYTEASHRIINSTINNIIHTVALFQWSHTRVLSIELKVKTTLYCIINSTI